MGSSATRLIPKRFRKRVVVCLVGLAWAVAAAGQTAWVPIGPEGGDVRSLTYDPRTPGRVYLGTSAGQLFVSNDKGESWARLAHLGESDDTVIDHIVVDPQSGTMFAATWRADEASEGDLYRSQDQGATWEPVEGMRGKSIRAFAMAGSNPRTLVAGTLDGVYRSEDAGQSWEQISPPGHAEIKNIESVAIDPKNPEVIYAGTWHLPWKTEDGGLTWQSIKQGVIDDSDVFSIIVSHANSKVVYASACSGIYKSETGGERFQKMQGIPSTARRTRVLRQDPRNASVIYAGTTEGLWKTVDAGTTWKRVTGANSIVNDVLVDPQNPAHILVATDRSGVLLSRNAGATFAASNRGFTHRHVATLLVDRNDSSIVYAGVINDKEFGGVFMSVDGGLRWTQRNGGLGNRDVFVLRQTPSGELLAGTNSGLFVFSPEQNQWLAAGDRPREVVKQVPVRGSKRRMMTVGAIEHDELRARVHDIEALGERLFAATSAGLYASDDNAKSWTEIPTGADGEIVSLRATPNMLVAATARKLLASLDGGRNWYVPALPSYVTKLNGVTVDNRATIWLATREGALRSSDGGDTWEHVLAGLPHSRVLQIVYDDSQRRLLATAGGARDLFVSTDGGRSWHRENAGYALRAVVAVHGRLLASTAFDGVIVQRDESTSRTTVAAGTQE